MKDLKKSKKIFFKLINDNEKENLKQYKMN